MTYTGQALARYLKGSKRSRREFAISAGITEGHFSYIIQGKRKRLQPDTINAILGALPEDHRADFISAVTLDIIDETYHRFVTGDSVQEQIPADPLADATTRLTLRIRKLFPPADRDHICSIVAKVLENAANSPELLAALEQLSRLSLKK